MIYQHELALIDIGKNSTLNIDNDRTGIKKFQSNNKERDNMNSSDTSSMWCKVIQKQCTITRIGIGDWYKIAMRRVNNECTIGTRLMQDRYKIEKKSVQYCYKIR
jgi:hypothetical protein